MVVSPTSIKFTPRRWLGYLLLLAAACCWGMIGPVSRYAFEAGIEPLEVAFWRAFLAWFLFGFHAWVAEATAVQSRHALGVALFAVLCVAVFYGAYQRAVDEGGAALASVLLYTAPAWVALLARWMLGERITRVKLAAIFVTLAGVVLVAFDGQTASAPSRTSALAIGFGLLSGFTYSLYFIFGKTLLRHYATPTLFLYALPLGSALLYPLVRFNEKNLVAWLSILFIAVVSTYLAYLAYYAGLRYLEATRAAVVVTIEPVVAALFAWLWWDERFAGFGWLGSVAILGAVLLIILTHRAPQGR